MSRSAAVAALVAAIPADITLCVRLACTAAVPGGEISAKTSCMTLPSGPWAVMSVSPVARDTTNDSSRQSATATVPAHQATPKASTCSTTIAMPSGIIPATIQRAGTSTAWIGASDAPSLPRAPRRATMWRRLANARAIERQCRARLVTLEKTSTVDPVHSAQRSGWYSVPPPTSGSDAT